MSVMEQARPTAEQVAALERKVAKLERINRVLIERVERSMDGQGSAFSLFQTAIDPTPARITGVGFFDRSHGQTGAAPNVIELHTVLKIEWM